MEGIFSARDLDLVDLPPSLNLIVAIAPADAVGFHLAPPTPSKRKKYRLTTHPLTTTPRFDPPRFGIATEAPLRAGNRRAAIRLDLWVSPGSATGDGYLSCSLARCMALQIGLSSRIISILTQYLPTSSSLAMGRLRERVP